MSTPDTTARTETAETVTVPTGWYLVPEVPTEEQMNAGLYQASHDATYADVCQSYMDMVRTPVDAPALSPQHPVGVRGAGNGLRFIVGATYDHLGENPYYGTGLTCIFCSQDGWALMRLGEWPPHLVLNDRDWKLATLSHPPAQDAPGAAMREVLELAKTLVSMVTDYLQPETYIRRFPAAATKWATEFEMPHEHASAVGKREAEKRRDTAFILDVIRLQETFSHPPVPTGAAMRQSAETTKLIARLQGWRSWMGRYDTMKITGEDMDDILAALDPSPPLPEADKEVVPEPILKAVERILDEHSAWVARPNDEVTRKIAFAVTVAAYTAVQEANEEEAALVAATGWTRRDLAEGLATLNGEGYSDEWLEQADHLLAHLSYCPSPPLPEADGEVVAWLDEGWQQTFKIDGMATVYDRNANGVEIPLVRQSALVSTLHSLEAANGKLEWLHSDAAALKLRAETAEAAREKAEKDRDAAILREEKAVCEMTFLGFRTEKAEQVAAGLREEVRAEISRGLKALPQYVADSMTNDGEPMVSLRGVKDVTRKALGGAK